MSMIARADGIMHFPLVLIDDLPVFVCLCLAVPHSFPLPFDAEKRTKRLERIMMC